DLGRIVEGDHVLRLVANDARGRFRSQGVRVPIGQNHNASIGHGVFLNTLQVVLALCAPTSRRMASAGGLEISYKAGTSGRSGEERNSLSKLRKRLFAPG